MRFLWSCTVFFSKKVSNLWSEIQQGTLKDCYLIKFGPSFLSQKYQMLYNLVNLKVLIQNILFGVSKEFVFCLLLWQTNKCSKIYNQHFVKINMLRNTELFEMDLLYNKQFITFCTLYLFGFSLYFELSKPLLFILFLLNIGMRYSKQLLIIYVPSNEVHLAEYSCSYPLNCHRLHEWITLFEHFLRDQVDIESIFLHREITFLDLGDGKVLTTFHFHQSHK